MTLRFLSISNKLFFVNLYMKIKLSIFVIPLLFLLNCKKQATLDPPMEEPPKIDTSSKVMFVHASPNTPKLDIYNGANILNISNFSYFSNSIYYGISTDSLKSRVKIYNTTSTLRKDSFNIVSKKYYTAFLQDVLSNLSFQLVEDDLTPPVQGKAKIRIAQMSPGSGSFDIKTPGATINLFSNCTFKSVTGFLNTNAANYTFEISDSGSSIPFFTINNLNLVAGKSYTLVLRGQLTGTGNQSFNYSLITNN
jgi:hypothetical protein